ncbi:dTDP-4-dehydrorhamnose 3,5-epimerase family protein [Actinotalea sp. Marseille-Q4924]|uniref:dTDP-4-dehydrorhamnose 3,5-epimerase family protein n=1 Tax=Actinotalea sp. Marseille-Q4924 TaxID=2866571 RepID=UPI001CE3E83A|nr:dTDP-4-dehydrorhamnose 3,5-epimerase [Actinotalea sp. Marseille-Q4924]
MEHRELAVAGALELTPRQFTDPRGTFLEWFRSTTFEGAVGHPLDLQQANMSVSASGVVRGVHFADVPPGQAKYVTCVRGAVLDVVVDIRVGSPTFGRWDSVLLDDVDRRAIYVPEGLGHAFMSLEDGSTVAYLCSSGYAPEREHGIHPLDPALGIRWPEVDRAGRPVTPALSDKDADAPTLDSALREGLLPRYDDVVAYLSSLGRATDG